MPFCIQAIGEVDAAGEPDHLYHFSVGTPGARSIKSRVIVSYQSSSTGASSFKCQRDQGQANCAHISQVQGHELIKELVLGDDDEGDDEGVPVPQLSE